MGARFGFTDGRTREKFLAPAHTDTHPRDHIMADPKKSAEFQQRSRPIVDEVVKRICSCVPKDWRLAMLQLDVSYSPVTERRSIKHRLWNPLTDQEVCDFPGTLFQATNALHTIFVEYDQPWGRCLFSFSFAGEGRNYQIDYHYGPPNTV